MQKRKSQPMSPEDGESVRPVTITEIGARILGYFRQNAQAMDSIDGIARFWLREDRSVVEACLVDLSARGLLEKRTIAGTDFYSLPQNGLPRPIGAAVLRCDGRGWGRGGTLGRGADPGGGR